ncbi:MAG TPA: nucleoside deaminase [Chlorobaculum sp.]|uniref:Cytidine and deoxycytidylate deaminase family protein n=1 Tax=Chlorobaculum tepidum (strain ATCC 49652 / DSM 12025 / NBRC 103806 / TLS) TaxID=194439 RepID=Q8KDQ1_CHLTE|nr:nucleoside deaminase [Chlorobaculum tepidum]AAM72229.1 cytidine and deoxycytidylate deaminase family protein [Chlorobaculum tepidum TLS]HBU23042.1 nucleoside deaminase [Chlorobaculum sp.]
MSYQPSHIRFSLPEWLESYCGTYQPSASLEARMRFVVGASRKSVEEVSGGPFAAAVFEIESGRLVSLGVNLVLTQNSSILHAEMVAIVLAQMKLGAYDLGGFGMPAHELVTSTEPCVMCFGAVLWSGVRHLATGALSEDARAIGFDEGPKPEKWIEELEARGIRVTTGVERDTARDVLQLYARMGGQIYNARKG